MLFLFSIFLLNIKLLSSKCASNCYQCSSPSKCTICQPQYYLGAAGICYSCSLKFPNCATCTSSSCSKCNLLYSLYSGECNSCSVDHCSQCSTKTTCSICDSEYYLSGASCYPCTDFDQQCQSCNNSQCQTCSIGYYLNALNTCARCNETFDPLCASCNGQRCISCQTGHSIFSNNTCDSNCEQGYFQFEDSNTCYTCNSLISYCSFCSNTSCFSCYAGYNLTNNTCYKINSGSSSSSATYLTILGAILGPVLLILLLGCVVYFCKRSQRRRLYRNRPSEPQTSTVIQQQSPVVIPNYQYVGQNLNSPEYIYQTPYAIPQVGYQMGNINAGVAGIPAVKYNVGQGQEITGLQPMPMGIGYYGQNQGQQHFG